jgi:SlyX protein
VQEQAVSSEERFIDIEIKLAHQEDLVESLNQRVYEQQKQIDQLEAIVIALAERVRNTSQSNQTPLNERPPHY